MAEVGAGAPRGLLSIIVFAIVIVTVSRGGRRDSWMEKEQGNRSAQLNIIFIPLLLNTNPDYSQVAMQEQIWDDSNDVIIICCRFP